MKIYSPDSENKSYENNNLNKGISFRIKGFTDAHYVVK